MIGNASVDQGPSGAWFARVAVHPSTSLRYAQDERGFSRVPGPFPFVVSLSNHERECFGGLRPKGCVVCAGCRSYFDFAALRSVRTEFARQRERHPKLRHHHLFLLPPAGEGAWRADEGLSTCVLADLDSPVLFLAHGIRADRLRSGRGWRRRVRRAGIRCWRAWAGSRVRRCVSRAHRSRRAWRVRPGAGRRGWRSRTSVSG